MEENGELDDKFPIGLKVLAIDANVVCLKYLILLLHKCQYKVTATTKVTEAITLLKDEKDGFDIVITDVVGVDMDGFNLLRTIRRHRIDVPVVMVSANDELEMVKRGVMEGAEAYLLKPLGLSEVRNIWQHVLRKRRIISKKSNFNDINMVKVEYQDHQNDDNNINKKKPRVNWTKERHAKFIQAYEQLGEKERVPNNILKLMNEPQLSREHVASHLQKYREGLRKKKKARNYKASNFITSAELRAQIPTSGEFECFNFASDHNYNSMIWKSCDNQNILGFGSNNINNLYCPQHPLPLGGDCLNNYYSTNSQAFVNCPIDDVQAAAPIATWPPFPNNTTTGQCSHEVQLDKGISSYGGLMDNDDLSDIFRHLENFLT